MTRLANHMTNDCHSVSLCPTLGPNALKTRSERKHRFNCRTLYSFNIRNICQFNSQCVYSSERNELYNWFAFVEHWKCPSLTYADAMRRNRHWDSRRSKCIGSVVLIKHWNYWITRLSLDWVTLLLTLIYCLNRWLATNTIEYHRIVLRISVQFIDETSVEEQRGGSRAFVPIVFGLSSNIITLNATDPTPVFQWC